MSPRSSSLLNCSPCHHCNLVLSLDSESFVSLVARDCKRSLWSTQTGFGTWMILFAGAPAFIRQRTCFNAREHPPLRDLLESFLPIAHHKSLSTSISTSIQTYLDMLSAAWLLGKPHSSMFRTVGLVCADGIPKVMQRRLPMFVTRHLTRGEVELNELFADDSAQPCGRKNRSRWY